MESASKDAYLIVLDGNVKDLPPEDASDYEMWKWASRVRKGVMWIPVDVKMSGIGAGQVVGNGHCEFYKLYDSGFWTQRFREALERGERLSYDIILSVVTGVADSIAILPTRCWLSKSDWSYGIETMAGNGPMHWAPFMVEFRHFDQAIVSLIESALGSGGAAYVNPSAGTRLEGLKIVPFDRPILQPLEQSKGYLTSLNALKRLFREVERHGDGWGIEFNHLQPTHCDFLLRHGKHILRVECKELKTWPSERSPFVAHRIWHVLYWRQLQELDGRVFCMTRDEVTGLMAATGTIDSGFLDSHSFAGFGEASAHILQHAEAAKAAASMAIRELQPEDMFEHLGDFELELDNPNDPHAGRKRGQLMLSWTSPQLNAECASFGYGVCLPIGGGHPYTTHVIASHIWSEQDKKVYHDAGVLPLKTWTAAQSRCICLRMQDASSPPNIFPIDCPLAIRRYQYKKPAQGNGNRFFILGSILDHKIHRTGEARSSSYLLLPSGFTVLSDQHDPLAKASEAEKEDGSHYFWHTENRKTEHTRPKWRKANAISMTNDSFGFIPKKHGINPYHYVLNLRDGSLLRALRDILECEGDVRIDNPRWPGTNKLFNGSEYHQTVGEVLQASWDYGCKFIQ